MTLVTHVTRDAVSWLLSPAPRVTAPGHSRGTAGTLGQNVERIVEMQTRVGSLSCTAEPDTRRHEDQSEMSTVAT